MVSKESFVYLKIAKSQLKDAQAALGNKSYALCAFLSAMSAENATSALIIKLGAKPSKKHRNSLVLYRLASGAGANLKVKLLEIIDSMKKLEPHITKARYPIRKGAELLPPSEYYTKESAKNSFEKAEHILEIVNELQGE